MDDIIQYKKFVTRIAKGFLKYKSIMDVEDLVQYGYIGLLRADKKYNPEVGVHFKVFAKKFIRGEIYKAIAEVGYTIRIPYRQFKKKIRSEEALLSRKIMNSDFIYHQVAIKCEAVTIHPKWREKFPQLFAKLTPKQQLLITLRYGLNGDIPIGMKKISQQTGIHQSNVAAICQRAMLKLKELSNESIPA